MSAACRRWQSWIPVPWIPDPWIPVPWLPDSLIPDSLIPGSLNPITCVYMYVHGHTIHCILTGLTDCRQTGIGIVLGNCRATTTDILPILDILSIHHILPLFHHYRIFYPIPYFPFFTNIGYSNSVMVWFCCFLFF